MLDKYFADHAKKNLPLDPAVATLEDFLNYESDGKKMRDVVTKIAYVGLDANLAEARNRMLSVPDCQDVVVTPTGRPKEKAEGWLTNVDIAREAEL